MDACEITLTDYESRSLLIALQKRFEENEGRHRGFAWGAVRERIETNPDKLLSLYKMERTGGEPDVVGFDVEMQEYLFFDCSPESPAHRRNLCYDHAALLSRKKNQPESSALDMAASMGIDLLTEEQYRRLQELGEFDLRTSSWIVTPESIRSLGGALFCDRRYGHVFTYHNGAESYYSARGFRGVLRI